ncbi:MAG: hypothetical protein H3C64_08710 [Candidatus Kuenenia stuttgartiensis]|nr:hypothetical protein [Candidatus Kuenenia stuttgartiensis]
MENTRESAMWENATNTINSIQASFLLILQNWPLFLHILILQFSFAVLISTVLSKIISDRDLAATLSFLGGILGAVLFSLALSICKIKPSPSLGIAIYLLSLIIIVWQRKQIYVSASLGIMALFFFFILLLRLIFIQGLLVPPYADSATHWQIVRDFMNPQNPPQAFFHLSFDLKRYYHFGFHALAAWLCGITATNPATVILILGQYFQALAVLSIFPLVMVLSRNSYFAWMAMCVAGLFLPMPAYASNWGKYPAIASMVGISIVLTLWLIMLKIKPFLPAGFRLLFSLAIISSIVLHSRSILVLFAVGIAYQLRLKTEALRRKRLALNEDPDIKMLLGFTSVTLTFLMIIWVWEIEFSFWTLFALISIFTLAFFGDFFFTLFLLALIFIVGLGYTVSIRWPSLPVRFDVIFDRPFLLIFSYIPAIIFTWLGIEGLLNVFTNIDRNLFYKWALTATMVLGFGNIFLLHDHRPSDCCILLNDDDLFAFVWMQNNLPDDVLIGIAATGETGNLLPTDGGAWIEPLTKIPVRKLSSRLDFYNEIDNLCGDRIAYIYIDDLENSFDEYRLMDVGGIVRFSTGEARLYQLPCKNVVNGNTTP